MKNWLLVLFALLTISITPLNSRAAFIVKPPATASTPAVVNQKKPFMERKVPTLVKTAGKMLNPRPGNGNPGWPGAISFVCSMLGLLSVVFLFTPGLAVLSLLYLFEAIAGIIFGAIGVNTRRYSNTGLAIAGLVLGILEVLGLVLLIILLIAALTT